MVRITVDMGGGLELLFGKQKHHELDVVVVAEASTPSRPVTMRDVLVHLRAHVLKERPELFMSGDTVRPGILVLVNDADWELDGGLNCEVQEGDAVALISTLHGG